MKKVLFIAALFSPALAFANFGYSFETMMPWGWGGMMGSGGILGWLSSLVWLVVGVFAAIWLWQHIDRK